MIRYTLAGWLGFLTAALVNLAQPPLASAQLIEWTGYRDVHHRNDCRLARQVLTLGQPANKRPWALGVIPRCGPDGGSVLAAMLAAYQRASADTTGLAMVAFTAGTLVDYQILNSALAVVSDPASPPVVRVQAIRVVYHQFSPGQLASYDEFVSDHSRSTGMYDWTARQGRAIPPGADRSAVARLRQVTDDTANPAPVRIAAARVAGSIEAQIRLRETCTDGMSSTECARRVRERWMRERAKP